MPAQIAQEKHISAVLAMQKKYHKSEVGLNGKQGFLTFQCDYERLRTLNSELGIIVHVEHDEVLGYIILMTVACASQDPVYEKFIDTYRRINSGSDMSKIAVSAQYCVTENYRGGKVARSLFATQRVVLSQKHYTHSIGEIDSRNKISIACTQRLLGYKQIASYDDANAHWIMVQREEA